MLMRKIPKLNIKIEKKSFNNEQELSITVQTRVRHRTRISFKL